MQKPIETIGQTQSIVTEKKPDPKADIKVFEGPVKFVSKKKDDKELNQEKSLAEVFILNFFKTLLDFSS